MFGAICIATALLFIVAVYASKEANRLQDLKAVEKLQPLIDAPNVFFWRPQKVGSSTLLSILMSYGYRYNFLPKRKSSSNAYCRLFAKCAISQKLYNANVTQSDLEKYVMNKIPGAPPNNARISQRDLDAEKLSNLLDFKISLSHEMCNLNAQVIHETMGCTFSKMKAVEDGSVATRELFMVREPVSRAISVYYFWGELYKMKHGMKKFKLNKIAEEQQAEEGEENQEEPAQKRKGRKGNKRKSKQAELEEEQRARQLAVELKLGQSDFSEPVLVHGERFQYHGQESTAPPLDIAMRYASHSIYRPGMPGPSYTWSAFADNLQDALAIVRSDRICTVILERLDDSLVVASHYLGWSLADVVVMKHRKALSSHPKANAWPQPAVRKIHAQLNSPAHGEYAMYNASVQKLDERIAVLKKKGIVVAEEVAKLKVLQKRVSQICLDDAYMLHYRDMIQEAGLPQHPSHNKLREVEEKYVQHGHMFSFNREILLSFDVCGPCEAHAMLLSIELGLAKDVETALPLAKMNRKHLQGNPNFVKCPFFL